MKKLKLLVRGFSLMVMAVAIFQNVQAQNDGPKPLFDINIDHEFPNSKESFDEVMELLLNNYYTTQLGEKDLYWAAIRGMLRHVSPPEHPELATIWTPEQYEQILNSLKGVTTSIGIESTFNSTEGSLTVTEVSEGSPSFGKLQLLDRILRIDGKVLKGLTINQVNQLIDGEAGTFVTLTISRDIEVFQETIAREVFDVKNLEVNVLPQGNIALVVIRKITLGIANDLGTELQNLRQTGVSKLILDLRNNGGGVLNEGVNVANLFLQKNNIIVRTVSRSPKDVPIVATRESDEEFEIVVLINAKTASSSEIIVSSLQDHGKAIIIGTKTYGKSVIEQTYTLNNDYKVKFIKSAMYTPKGQSWHSKGILPDFLVEQSGDSYNGLLKLSIQDRTARDIYLITALKLLKG